MSVNILFYIFFICFSHNVFSISEDSKTKKTVSNVKGEQYNRKQIQKINTRLQNQEKQIKRLNSGLENQKDQIEEQKDQIEEQKTHFQNYISKQKVKNHSALFIVLFGLLLEILGALLLGVSL